jgi:hypothetical protein
MAFLSKIYQTITLRQFDWTVKAKAMGGFVIPAKAGIHFNMDPGSSPG